MLTTVEKVIFLQGIDIFSYTSTEDLALIGAITEEVQFPQKTVIYKEGATSDSMYLVLEGKVLLEREGKEVMTVVEKGVFGTWALFDDEPRVVSAKALEDSRFLKIDKEDFYDLLADNVQITQGILKMITRRLRNLIERVGRDTSSKAKAEI
jgi:CRP-like cAMP-binding protein